MKRVLKWQCSDQTREPKPQSAPLHSRAGVHHGATRNSWHTRHLHADPTVQPLGRCADPREPHRLVACVRRKIGAGRLSREITMARSPSLTLLCTTLVLAGLTGLPCAPAHGQASPDSASERLRALERRLDASQQLIEKLTERIAELERAAGQVRATADAPAAPTAEQAKAISSLRDSVEQMSEGLSRNVAHTGVPIHGFADVGAAWSGRGDPARLRGFEVGTLDLYLTPQFGSHVKALAEIAFYYRADGHGEIEAERMQLGYTVSDSLTLWGGRFHTPIGLWNTAYHHGANLQTSIYRPRFIEFEDSGGLLPTHSIGVWASGKLRLGQDRLGYDVYLSNGPTVRGRVLDYNAFTDDNGGKLHGLNLYYQPSGALRGVTVGVHGLGSTVDTRDASGGLLARTRLRMGGGYFGYDAQGWDALGEYYRFANRDLAAGTRRFSDAWYLQVGRTLGSLMPYGRYERASLDGADRFFATQLAGRSYTRSSLGARYDLDGKSALKIELGKTTEAAASLIDDTGAASVLPRARYHRTAIEYSIAF